MEENKNILVLAEKEYIVECNFRKQHDLTKFRNKLSYGFDFSEAEKPILEEIFDFQQALQEGKEVNVSELSNEAIKYLNKTADKTNVFSADELIEIGMILTNNSLKTEVEEIFDEEVKVTSYDTLIEKLISAMNLVFLNAKSGLKEKTQIVEMKANEVAK